MEEVNASQESSCSLTAGSETTFDIVCDPCDSEGDIEKAEGYCQNCHEHLCTMCIKYHKRGNTKHHVIVDKDSMPQIQGASQKRDVCTQRCKLHEDETIKYYCSIHKCLGCGDCMVLSHDTCKDKIYIPETSKGLADGKEFKDFQAWIQQMTNKTDSIIQSSKNNINVSADYRIAALQEIETFRQEITVALDKLTSSLQEQIQEKAAGHEATMRSVVDKTSHTQANLKRISTEIDTLVNKRQNCQMFIEMKSKDSELTDIQKQLGEFGAISVAAVSFKPNDDLLKLLRQNGAFGELTTKESNGTSATHVIDINVNTPGNKLECRVNGATLLSKDRLVIADRNNNSVKLIDTELQQIMSEYTFEEPPYDVACIHIKQVAVTLPDSKNIVFLISEDTLNSDKIISVDQPCWHLAHFEDNLIVSFKDPYEVRIMSMTGHTLKTISFSSQGERLFRFAPRVTVSAFTQAIYASDWEAHCVTMFDLNGDIIADYKNDDLKNSAYTAVDENGMVYVCGMNSHTIYLLTPYCNKVKIILTEKEGIKWPCSLSYCGETRKLFVGMSNNSVKVYQIA